MEHQLARTPFHHRWERDTEPTLRIESGDVVELDLEMAGAGQIREGDRYEDTTFDFDSIYRLLGPIFVAGARPGDTLRVEILSMTPGEWGWCGVEPDLGLLPDDFPVPFVKTFDMRDGKTVQVCPQVRIPLAPFLGTMGTQPDAPERFLVSAAQGRRQHRHPAPDRGEHAVAADLVRWSPVLVRRSARRPGRRGGVYRRPGVRHAGDLAVHRRTAHDRRAALSDRRRADPARSRAAGTTARWVSART